MAVFFVVTNTDDEPTSLTLVGSAADRVDGLEGKECGAWTSRMRQALRRAYH
jgi:hypothetical protein